MKFCQPHWDKLRHAINARGLSDFVAADEKEVVQRLRDGGFEPLMGAHNAIVKNAMDQIPNPMELLLQKEDGTEWCPICYLNEKDPLKRNYDEWIDRAADDMKAIADEVANPKQTP